MISLSHSNVLPLLVLAGCLLCCIGLSSVRALSCLPCGDWTCVELPACPGGVVKGACGCCDVCAKVESQTCGGPWNIGGICDKGLFCDRADDFSNGICRPETRGLEKCPVISIYGYPRYGYRSYMCEVKETTFCRRNCASCCVHSTTCNPNPWLYISSEGCRMENQEIPGLATTLTTSQLTMARRKRGLDAYEAFDKRE